MGKQITTKMERGEMRVPARQLLETKMRKLKKVLRIVLGATVLLLVVLVVHIAMVVKPSAVIENASRQMSRVDFGRAPLADQQQRIDSLLRLQPGVNDVYFGAGGKILIFTFDAHRNRVEDIFGMIRRQVDLPVSLHKVSATEAAQGCPVTDPSSFAARISSTIAAIF